MEKSIDIGNLTCAYSERVVLDAISLSVSKNEFIALLGPNGSGKTTLLKTISKIIKPSKGSVLVEKIDIVNLSHRELAKKVAVVPQESALTFAFTALQVVLMGRTPYLNKWQFEQASDIGIAKKAMEMTNTWQFADRCILELSGGEKQRVIIAQALAQEPEILLLDEPTLHLDLNHQLEIMETLKRLNEQGLTIVAVLHDLNSAAYYADKLVLLHEGKVDSVGSPYDVLTLENVKRVFKTDISVGKHPFTGKPYIWVLPANGTNKEQAVS